MRGLFLVAIASIAGIVSLVSGSGCASPADTGTPQHVCKRDLDCGDHHYCSAAAVCTADCFNDTDCLGPARESQCNAQGRCIDAVDASPPPPDDASVGDSKPKDSSTEAGK